ncbi:MAG: diguanylate cyclase [Deferribacterales bacterium]
MEQYISNGEQIRMVLIPKHSAIMSMRKRNISAALLIAVIVLAVSIPLSWVAAYIPSMLQAKLAASNYELNKFHSIMDKYLISATTDKNQVITSCSKAFTDITEYSADELIGQTNKLIRHPENDPAIYKDLWDTITEGKVWEGDLRCVSKTGKTFWLHKIISPDLDEKGQVTGYTSIDYDCTDAKLIEEMSVTDQLTGLYNRRKLDESLETEMVRFNRYKHDFCVILLDIDHFKKVNDTFGHSEGDRVLKELASILKANTRATDTVGRWGGEEFLIVASETDITACARLAEKIRLEVQEHYFGSVGRVTISLGAAQYTYGDTISHFIVNADSALYKAKQNGRNRTELHNG